MRRGFGVAVAVAILIVSAILIRSALQTPAVRSVDESMLGEYAGVYRWQDGGLIYLQLWDEFSGFGRPRHLTAFDESGEIRTLYPLDGDEFFAGPGIAVSSAIESRVDFQRDRNRLTSLAWRREGGAPRLARRVDVEKHEHVHFSNGEVRLAGTLIAPARDGPHPALILVHGSGAANRSFVLPFARFLIRRGMAVLGYDKRGVGDSTGDWTVASFEDLASDVLAAVEYLKTRSDIDHAQIGLLGISQAGWIMPLAAARSNDLAFLISVSGAGIPPADTTIDQAQNEMTAGGMRSDVVAGIIELMQLQYAFARTGQGWEQYRSARERLAFRMGQPPDTFPGTQDHPQWETIRRSYLYDPAPTLRQLRTPVLAMFGELDNNIVAGKNKEAWERALKAGAHPDYTLQILPKANHYQWEAKIGTNAEMASLRRFVPEYFTGIECWLANRIRGFEAPECAA
jgi:uncharacterized protein